MRPRWVGSQPHFIQSFEAHFALTGVQLDFNKGRAKRKSMRKAKPQPPPAKTSSLEGKFSQYESERRDHDAAR
eukprot:SAG11_NODE_1537_length_4724_cov_4.318270_3_plen_73_part_00